MNQRSNLYVSQTHLLGTLYYIHCIILKLLVIVTVEAQFKMYEVHVYVSVIHVYESACGAESIRVLYS